RAGFDRLGDVNSEVAQAQLGARRTAAADGFSDLEMADGCADAATDAELPWVELGLGKSRYRHHHQHEAHRESPRARARHAGLLGVGREAGARGRTHLRDGTPASSSEDQLSGFEAIGGARGRAALRSGAPVKTRLAGSALSIQTRQGSVSRTDGETVANVLAMKATTGSKASSSQKPPIHRGAGGSA